MFNALKYIQKLEAVGCPRERVEVHVQLVIDSIEEDVATKGDLTEVKSEMSMIKAEISSLRSELRSEISTLKAAIKADLAEVKLDILVKIGALFVTTTTLATAFLGFLIKF